MKTIFVKKFEVTISLKNGLKQKFTYEEYPEDDTTIPFLRSLVSAVGMYSTVDKIMSFTGNGIELLLNPAMVASLSVISAGQRCVDLGLGSEVLLVGKPLPPALEYQEMNGEVEEILARRARQEREQEDK